MTRAEVLEAARVCVCGGRDADYGQPEDCFGLIGRLWGSYLAAVLGVPIGTIAPEHVAGMMALLKLARDAAGNRADSYVDLAGYAACMGELATRGHGDD